jgi:electron transfer flavoprotein alpha subunit
MEQVWGKNPERFVIKTKKKDVAKTPPVSPGEKGLPAEKKEVAKKDDTAKGEPTAADPEKLASDKLKAAEFILKAGRKDRAKEQLDEIIKLYPATEAGKKAAELRKTLS